MDSRLEAYGLRFHHFGLAARQPERARAFLHGLGYAVGQTVFDPEQNVNLIMGAHPVMPDVEIISPGPEAGPVDQILKEHSGIVYHLCFETDDLAATLDALAADGVGVLTVSRPRPAVLFDERRVSFYLVRGFGLIEILEKQ